MNKCLKVRTNYCDRFFVQIKYIQLVVKLLFENISLPSF